MRSCHFEVTIRLPQSCSAAEVPVLAGLELFGMWLHHRYVSLGVL